MADLKIYTDLVISTANKIKSLNIQMSNDFSSVQSAVSRLDNVWEGTAATKAMEKFNSIKNSYCNARYTVIDDFVAFLHHQVGEGYNQTEETNTSLAGQFK